MIWNNILLENEPALVELTKCLGTAFGVPESKVVVLSKLEDLAGDVSGSLLCLRHCVRGEYRTFLDIYIIDNSLVPPEMTTTCKAIARYLGYKCLWPDDSEREVMDAMAMCEVDARGQVFSVHLDPDAEDRGEFVVTKRVRIAEGD